MRALALEILGQHHRRLRVVDGPLALEITPRLGWTKGTAVRLFLDALPLRSRLVLYAGDHANDLDAIEAVEGLAGITIAGTANGGITIGIGEHAPPVAKFRMDSPRQFGAWLTDLETALRGQVT